MAASHFHQFGSRQFCSALQFLIIFRLCLIQSTLVRSGCEMALTSPQAQRVKKTLNKWNSQTDKMAERTRNKCYFISWAETSSTAKGARGGDRGWGGGDGAADAPTRRSPCLLRICWSLANISFARWHLAPRGHHKTSILIKREDGASVIVRSRVPRI